MGSELMEAVSSEQSGSEAIKDQTLLIAELLEDDLVSKAERGREAESRPAKIGEPDLGSSPVCRLVGVTDLLSNELRRGIAPRRPCCIVIFCYRNKI
mmetsp:Transcript_88268/g.234721  ORF Transcript_88268/g.234721 Transcript_88268/m.234721 type:complete len:97 (+) Transcript_88268:594-884(+)